MAQSPRNCWTTWPSLFVEVAQICSFRGAAEATGIRTRPCRGALTLWRRRSACRSCNGPRVSVELLEVDQLYYEKRIVEEARIAHEKLGEMLAQPSGTLRTSLPVDFATIYMAHFQVHSSRVLHAGGCWECCEPVVSNGTVALPENQPHRADVAKMLIRCDASRQGIARHLMSTVDEMARAAGNRTQYWAGDDAERLFWRIGWQRVGSTQLCTDARWHDLWDNFLSQTTILGSLADSEISQ